MISTQDGAAAGCQSLWPELLTRVPSLSDFAPSFADTDVQCSRRFGLYQDMQAPGYYMLRVKVLGATLAPRQLLALGTLAQDYGQGTLKLTTRQCVQIHWLRGADLPAVFAGIAAAGLTPRGAGGSTVLNITGCPVSGIDEHEHFDCRATWHELAVCFQREKAYFELPRKLKMTISACEGQCNAPSINCIAFAGTRQAGDDGSQENGFDMLVGGGLGTSPRLARSLGVFLAAHEVVEAARVVVDLWRENPDFHKTKGRSRLKWMVDQIGPDGVRAGMERRLGRQLRDLTAGARGGEAVDPGPSGRPRQKDGKTFIGLPVLAASCVATRQCRLPASSIRPAATFA